MISLLFFIHLNQHHLPMKRIFFNFSFVAAVLLVFIAQTIAQPGALETFRKSAPAPGPAPKVVLGTFEQFQLANGLKVIVVENHKVPLVSFQVTVDGPKVHEGEMAGYIETAGALLATGTTTRTKAQINNAVDFMGASLNSSGGGISGSCLTKHVDGLLELMSDVLMHPTFPKDEFDKIILQTQSALLAGKTSPDYLTGNVSQVLNYGKNHPYGNVTTEISVKKITLDACKAYYQNYFRPNISYLVIVGDIVPGKAKELAEKYFGSWERKEVQDIAHPTPQPPQKTQVAFVDKPGAVQSVIRVTYPVVLTPGAPDAIKANVLNTLLGGPGFFGSRLLSNLREDKGYTYGATSFLNSDPLVGCFEAEASVRNEVTDSSVTQFLLEMNRLRSKKVEEGELTKVKNFLSGAFARSLESPWTVARFAYNIVRYNLPPDYYATYLEKMAAVTSEDLMAVAKKYILPDQAYILVVGDKTAVAKKLIRFDKDKKIGFYDADGNLLPEQNLDLPGDLTAAKVFENYINAIGGKEAVEKVNSLKTVMSAESPNGKIVAVDLIQKPSNFMSTLAMNGNVVIRQVFNGEKGIIEVMGKFEPMDEEMVKSLRENVEIFPELNYLDRGFTANLVGVETVNDIKAYRIDVISPSGEKVTKYYQTENGLLIRELEQQEQDGQTATIITDYGEYKSVNGVMIPHTQTVTGFFPMPLELKIDQVEVNGTVNPFIFKIQ